jgi:hypothetical protein
MSTSSAIARSSRAVARLYSPPLLWLLLLGTVGFSWVFNFSSFPFSNPELLKLSGGEGLLDLLPYYTAEKAFEALGHYGAAGRALYSRYLFADFLFIPCYSLGLALLITRALWALWGETTARLPLNLLPFGIALFDIIENVCIAAMLRLYPAESVVLGTLSGVATFAKTLLTATTLLFLAGAGIVVLLRARRGRMPRRAD